MKKLVSIILAVMLVSALAVTSFAAPTVEYVFDTDEYTYVFGKMNTSDSITDAGLKITNKNNKREMATFSSNEEELSKVQRTGKYGVGIKSNNMLNDSFTVKPYYTTASETVDGASYVINGAEGIKKTVAEGLYYIPSNVGNIRALQYASALDENFYLGDYNPEGVGYSGKYSKHTLLKFDLTTVDTVADEIYLTIATNNSRREYANLNDTAGWRIDVYGAESGTFDQNSTWAALLGMKQNHMEHIKVQWY